MAVSLIVGKPKSGKSYVAVKKLFDMVSTPKFKYKRIYCNVNQLDTDSLITIAKQHGNTIELLTYDHEKTFEIVKKAYLNRRKSDDELLELLKEDSFSHSLYMVDEAQYYFDAQRKEIIYWLSYHAHFFQDIMLFTHDKESIARKYRIYPELYTVILPSTFRIGKSIRLKDYAGMKETRSAVVRSYAYMPEQNIFDLYVAGDHQQQDKIIKRLIVLPAIAFVLLLLMLIYAYQRIYNKEAMKEQEPLENTTVTKNIPLQQNEKTIRALQTLKPYEQLKPITFTCFTNDSCRYHMNNNSYAYPEQYVLAILKKFNGVILFQKTVASVPQKKITVQEYHILLDEKVFFTYFSQWATLTHNTASKQQQLLSTKDAEWINEADSQTREAAR